ncbi:MAG: glycolate oxidase subunit GlcE, partial [Pseudomonadota bacterium]
KAFYGREAVGEPLRVGAHCGVVNYEPTELVITARGGTPLHDVEAVLAEHNQIFAFEPPYFGDAATLGGVVATGLSGPRRPFAGSVRDYVLGCKVLTGKGEMLSFGGQVMKNVAGYDVSRLMVGAMGTLGVLLEVSLKVLPAPAAEATLCFEMETARSLRAMNQWAGLSLPLSALCYDGARVYVRLSGSARAVAEARGKLGGELLVDAAKFWEDLREMRLPYFQSEMNLWRISGAPAAPELKLDGRWLYDWGGAQRWLLSDERAGQVFDAAAHGGGHATLFRGRRRDRGVFQPLTEKHMALQRGLKRAFDPSGILNAKRMYDEW